MEKENEKTDEHPEKSKGTCASTKRIFNNPFISLATILLLIAAVIGLSVFTVVRNKDNKVKMIVKSTTIIEDDNEDEVNLHALNGTHFGRMKA